MFYTLYHTVNKQIPNCLKNTTVYKNANVYKTSYYDKMFWISFGLLNQLQCTCQICNSAIKYPSMIKHVK